MEEHNPSKENAHFSTVLRVVCFVLVGLVLFLCIQSVLTPKRDDSVPKSVGTPFQTLQAASPAQVLFLGASPIFTGISPMDIYGQYGITALDLSSGDQDIGLSYNLLAETLRSWTPEVVVLEVGKLVAFPEGESWLNGLTYTPFSRSKLRSALTYAADIRDRGGDYQQALAGALVPLYQFHSRWAELSAADLRPDDPNPLAPYAKGFSLCLAVKPAAMTVEEMNAMAEAMVAEPVHMTTVYTDGQKSESEQYEGSLYAPAFSERGVNYFEKIHSLCAEKGIDLLLLKVPVVYDPVASNTAWTLQWHKMMDRFAAEHGVPFVDPLYDADLDFDWAHDSTDGGGHLNTRGARKVSAYMGAYLRDTYGLPAVSDPAYDAALALYDQAEAAALLQSEPDLTAWLDRIRSSGRDLTVFMAACDDMTEGLAPEDIRSLGQIGLQTDFAAMDFGDTFLAVWEHSAGGTDTIPYEAASNRDLTYTYETADGAAASLFSRGHYQHSGNVAIEVNGVKHSARERGLWFVVYDRASAQVLDDMRVDFSAGGAVIHINTAQNLLTFESWLGRAA